ncbi:M1 family metallopeptidase [Novosphingopyxis sp.]|uniref:M1 family metallopeptidase n=1 Tax=Novosphingopyxis sp. TaxID=2709690 RepID=UPI003B5C3B7D
MPMIRNPGRLFAAASMLALAVPASAQMAEGTAADAKPATQADTVDTRLPTQLPRTAVPHRYSIQIAPDAQALAFGGSVRIALDIVKATDKLVLNAADLAIDSATIYGSDNTPHQAKITLDADAQTASFDFGEKLPKGAYRFDIVYTGTISTQANGLFALDYKDPDGTQRRGLFTQFEAPDARRFVPSWDEPDYKAVFDLTATVPSDQMPLSNMPVKSSEDLGGGMSKVTFGTTPTMSSYLLFFGLGDFERIHRQAGGTDVGIVMSRGKADQGQYALDSAAAILPFYNDYFGTPYPLPKLDNIAGPGQSQFFGAMENWGAIFTFERILLNDPTISSEGDRQRIFSVAAHEMAHQWFGDLVTMAWWDDLWLNEGFASWMENKTTSTLHPEWGADIDRVGSRESAMRQDAYEATHPIVQTIRTVEQTNQAFDSITYSKGESVIAMLEAYAGADVWRKGVQDYVKAHQYRNTRTDDLWKAVEAAGADNLTRIAHQFTLQPGVPLIQVGAAQCRGGDTAVTLTQSEFSADRREAVAAKPQSWNVPVLASTVGGGTVDAVTEGRTTQMTVPGCAPLLVNAGQAGYYRTLYGAPQLAALAQNFSSLKPIDQYGLLNDNIALAYAGYQPIGGALDLVAAIPADADPKVLAEGLGSWTNLYGLFEDEPAVQEKIGQRIQAKYAPVLSRLGFTVKDGEPAGETLLRPTLISALGATGLASVEAERTRLLKALATDPKALDGPLKTTWLGLIARDATPAEWEQLHRLAQDAGGFTERSALYSALGGAKDDMLAAKALDLAITDEPGATIGASLISSVAVRHPEMALDFALAHPGDIDRIVDNSAQSRYVARIAAGSDRPETIGKLEAYAKANLGAEARKPVDQTIGVVKTRIEARQRIMDQARQWIDAHAV